MPHPSPAPILPTVGVVILNHNGKELTETCIRSVLAADYPHLTIVVVDNASTDGSIAHLHTQFPTIEIIANPENLGVTAGRNRGFQVASQLQVDYILSLDNDARIHPEAIRELIAVATPDPTIGVLGPKTYNDDGSHTLQCTGGQITYTQNVTNERGAGEIDRGQYDRIEAMDYFPGCTFMARRDLLEQLDFLDESFVGYGHEDTDFCTRAIQRGYRVVYVPKAIMWHGGSSTIGSYTPRKKYLEAVNSIYYVRKYGGWGDRLKYAFFAGFGLVYALVVQGVQGNQRAVVAKARGLWDGLKKPVD